MTNAQDTTPARAEALDEGAAGELNTCPFCGFPARFGISRVGRPRLHWITCSSCDTSGPQLKSREKAIAAWNARGDPSRTTAPVAETAGEAVEDLWQELCERDDRTSPEEYPEMCLINFDELSDFIARATPPVPAQDDDKLRIAVEALESIVQQVEIADDPKHHTLGFICHRGTEALAALKSTAAQEGAKS